ncbi:MAG TPA: glycoside hydrolase family 95 protein [Phycisphaerae bacterium]|nr:glycoside hydrolase family 95 protein [Phycisphaerae bacterium]
MTTRQTGAYILWYTRPAEEWFEALPLGNGRLGAMVFGRVPRERLLLNEETIWTGGPYDPSQEVEPGALEEIRRLIFAGEHFKAHYLFGRTMMGRPVEQMKYQPLGNLWLEFPGHEEVADYRRQLDLDSAIACTTYRVADTVFTREVFASPVDQVIAVRLTADKPGRISFAAQIVGGERGDPAADDAFASEVAAPDELVLRGRTASFRGIEGRVRYEARVKVIAEGGQVSAGKEDVSVAGADAVTLLVAAATNFVSHKDLGGDPEARVRECLGRAVAKPYAQIRNDHLAEHRRLFRRVALELETTEASALPTDERLKAHAAGRDPALAALLFQFGRYLLISSSRPGCRPANLQGIWNESLNPAWECKFTTNINLEMNYWPAEVANLAECAEPLFHMLADLVEPGSRVARRHYGARGWVLHQNTDQWLAAAPMDGPTWGTWTTGGAWLCRHLWEHYLFGGDKAYLAQVYPVLKGAAEFFLDTLVEHPTRGWLVTCPATSPESFPACPGNRRYLDEYLQFYLPGTSIGAGPTMDMQILRDLFDACARAATILGVDAEFAGEVTRTRERLAPMQVGRRGNLQEWIEDWEDLEKQHRHISHLNGLYPADQITPQKTPELAAAAAVSLTERGDGSTGFSMTWKAACWARLGDGNHALLCLGNLVAEQTCAGLFSKCFKAPQVDGSFGATAAIAEMLLQSHAGEICLLPALPETWSAGAVTGLRARGGFEVDVRWEGGELVGAEIRSSLGGPCRIRYRDRTAEIETREGGRYAFP